MVSSGIVDSDWILDSGCSFHMTPNKYWFQQLDESDGGRVLLGNNQECRVKGVGTLQIIMFDNQVRIISEVRYVPELKRSLLSLGTFDKAGYVCKTEKMES